MKPSKKRTPLYAQIRQYIVDQITEGTWSSNDRIPSENELTQQFHVSRLTVKHAMSELIDDGLIYRVQGKGTFVCADPSGETLVYESQRDKKKALVALLMPRFDTLYTAQLLGGIEDHLSEHGYRLVFCTTKDSQEKEQETIQEMLDLGVQGILIYPVEGQRYSRELLRLTMNRFPLVLVDRYLQGIETSCVCSDNKQGAYDATSHLLALGHRQVAFITTKHLDTTSIDERLKGYEQALVDYQLPIDHRLRLVLQDDEAKMSPEEQIRHFLIENKDISAVFAINSLLGFAVMTIADELSKPVPDELSVVFFDNDLTTKPFIAPTYVTQEERKLGIAAAKLLLSLIDDPEQENQQIVLPTRLVVQGSTAKAARLPTRAR